MNKNLKKLISAVSAVAVSASSVAAFAASYPDVADTATYKQAVYELSALNIINGFDDGTFGPDQNVTRAQITKMIVTALGKTAVSAAEAATGKDTQFADVPASHWAAGFVSTGTSATAGSFINGYSDTAFGPEDNVTYAQAIKMLVAALGYSTYAEKEGGWPNGYLKYGYSLGLTDGVTGLGNDDAATRAQVAQMIDNALKCPVCVSNGYESDAWGRLVPKTVIKDGSGDLDGTKDGYQNLLNFAHDAYLVYGRVSETFKSSIASIKADEIKFDIEKSDNWLGYSVQSSTTDDEPIETITAYKGTVTDADKYLLAYAEAIIAENDDDEYTLISLTPYGSTESVELPTDFYKDIEITAATDKYDVLKMYRDNAKSKWDSYKIDKDFTVYVNGIEATGVTLDSLKSNTDYESLLIDNANGSITLVDTSKMGKSSTDGKYDYAMITTYCDAVVDVVEVEGDEITIYFAKTSDNDMDYELVVDLEDEEKDYNFTLNGEAIAPADLQPNDVLTITTDYNKSFANSNSYNVLVSRDTVEAKLTGIDEGDADFAAQYSFDNSESYELAWKGAAKLENGNSYVLYLNAFGKIAMVEDLVSSKKFAILENLYETNGGADVAAVVITTEGKATYLVDEKQIADLDKALMKDGSSYTDSDKMANRKAVQDRVIEYSIRANGELNFKGAVAPEKSASSAEFKASTNKVGGIKISEAITSFINVQEYLKGNDASSMSYSDFVSGSKYTAYGYGETGLDKISQFVVVTEGFGGLNVNSNMAVFVSQGTKDTDDGDMIAITALNTGKEEVLLTDKDFGLEAGDAFFYTVDGDGYVDAVYPVLDEKINKSYNALYTDALDKKFNYLNADVAAEFAGTDVSDKISFNRSDEDDCKLVFGAIVSSTGNEIGVVENSNSAKVANFNIEDDAVSYDVASDATVVVYDYSMSRVKDRMSVSRGIALNAMKLPKAAFNDEDEEFADLTSAALLDDSESSYGRVKLAVLKVVDDEVVEAVVYVPSTTRK